MNRAPPAISLRSAPAQRAPSVPVMSNAMQVAALAGAHPDFVREHADAGRLAHIPEPQSGKSREENRIAELEQDVAALFARVEALEAAAA